MSEDVLMGSVSESVRQYEENAHTSVSPNRAGKVRVYGTCQAIVTKSVLPNASRAEILCRKHAPGRHDADKGVESRFLCVLASAGMSDNISVSGY